MIYEAKEFTLDNGQKIILKTPDESEAESVLTFLKDVIAQTPFFVSSPEDFDFPVEKEKQYLAAFKTNNSHFIAVYHDGRIIGDCGIDVSSNKKTKHRCSTFIALDKDFCEMGIGTLLFSEIIKLAENMEGVEQIELGVISTNTRAIRLYTKMGFEKTGIIPNALKLKDGTYLDEIQMIRSVKIT